MLDSWSFHLSSSPSASSSARSSHLSVLTSVSSAAASPLPSPTGSKTHAFFASPFGDDSSMPQPPPNPAKRTNSLKSEASEVSAEDTPRLEQAVPARSLNAEFYGPSLLPTPPPSIRSFSSSASASGSRDNSTSPPSARFPLPPLSRFFPSRARYGTESDHPSPAKTTNVRRDFLHLDTSAPGPHAHPGSYHPGEYTIPPVDVEHFREDSSSQVTPKATRREETSYIVTQAPPSPPASEPEQQQSATKPAPGITLSSSSLTLELVKPLGTGTFSGVWLARDTKGQLGALELMRKSSLARSKSFRRGRSRPIDGTRPTRKKATKDRQTSDGLPVLSPDEQEIGRALDSGKTGRLVAVKMTERAICDANSRSRVSFVREVEVLRHISHPSIVSYLHSFSTPSHHCLVLEHVSGGELLDLVDNPESHARIDEPLVRRIWGELCKAVAWMHSVGLVHRDIKLENILLTTDPFARPWPSSSLIKLTDFGLSRFIDPAQPQLTTLCGSESYAAPELVMGRPYDGRETDTWACGVVLYALATRRLPFDSPPPTPDAGIPHERQMRVEADWEVQKRKRSERRALLVRIAKCEYAWPEPDPAPPASESDGANGEGPSGEARVAALARSTGIRRMVSRLLVRDPAKRARVADLWEDEWMRGEGAPPPPVLAPPEDGVVPVPAPPAGTAEVVAEPSFMAEDDVVPAVLDVDADAEVEVEADDEGVLVDSEDIGPGSVARQEH
ncbi:kinase-like domain-containing protein [Trametes punicea]|nr:kinase-like domain-containing protein [Trametes punicea]